MRQIQGYIFEDDDVAQKAYVEEEGINYIREQIPDNNPQIVLKLYQHLIDEKMFETPIGIGFLAQLQGYLKSSPEIDANDVSPIPISYSQNDSSKTVKVSEEDERVIRRELNNERKSFQKEKNLLNQKLKKLYFVVVLLVMIIIGMFGITVMSKNSVTILNYENKLINKYEDWENELNEREKQLNEREKELSESP